jgi:hypothetical protein
MSGVLGIIGLGRDGSGSGAGGGCGLPVCSSGNSTLPAFQGFFFERFREATGRW